MNRKFDRTRRFIVFALGFTGAALCAGSAEAKLVRVYYPEGHYLGCGTPAEDGSGIWGYDPRISEADCKDPVAQPGPQVAPSVGVFQLGDLDFLGDEAMSDLGLPSARNPDGGLVTPVLGPSRVDAGSQAGVGAVFQLRDWLSLEVGLSAGNATISSDSTQTGSGNEPLIRVDADYRLISGALAARFYPLASSRLRPWLSAGARGLSLDPTGGSITVTGRDLELSDRDLHSASTVDFTSGLGLDVRLTDRLGMTLSGDHGFRTGWRAGLSLSFGLPARFPRPPVPPCPPFEKPPCEPSPLPPWLPFPFPYPGQLHSDGLDTILVAVQNAAAVPPETPRTREDLFALVDATAIRFLRDRGLGEEAVRAYQEGRERAAGSGTVPGDASQRLSIGQRRYLTDIENLIDRTPERGAASPRFEALTRTALQDLGSSQALPVALAASVAGGSLDYWRSRSELWQDAVGRYLDTPREPQQLKKINWKKVGEADVKGAVNGAVKGAIGGAVSGGVAGVLPGAVTGAIGGAVGESAVSAILQLLF